ncbi:MAG: glutaminase [Halobacteriovoraceae bacterium]|nr:glutaminase [Halobacteriovoraceae bacterium]|tara:strand:- start:19812 stop:20726 length:915 start_codon:yes stop_codon:yes gene_type:complete
MNITAILEEIYTEIEPYLTERRVADYIPMLGRVDSNQFGMAVCTNDGDEYVIGSAQKNFSIQSVSKVFTFAMAYELLGQSLWKRVGKEPSGTKFNSLILLEQEKGIPRNPFINAGALVIADILMEHYKDPYKEVLKYIHELSGNPNIVINEEMKKSELDYANINYALTYFMKSFSNINSHVPEVVDFYSAHCSIEMSCVDLARAFRLFSQAGKNPWTGEKMLTKSQTKHINAIMMTSGLYNSVGDFAYRVGLPAKSGVGGAIVGVLPGEMSIAVWSPGLDANGNSFAGIKALELFTNKTELSIY